MNRRDADRALARALEDADNPTAAARALARVGRHLTPEAESSFEAFRLHAEKELARFFPGGRDESKPVAWSVLDAVRGNGQNPDREQGGEAVEAAPVIDAADLLLEPERLKVPEAAMPGIAFPESFSLYSGPPNIGGKTSLLVAGGYAVATGGRFLGEQVPTGTVLWVMGEGSEVHIGRYLAQVEAELPHGRFLVARSEVDPIGELEALVGQYEPDVVVIDSLGTWIAPMGVDSYTEEVVPPLRAVERVARSGPAVVMIHHGRKEDGDPAGSHKIKAVPDIVRTVEVGEVPSERVIQGEGRWRLPEIRYRMDVTGTHPEVPNLETVRFRVVDPDREIEEKILDYLDAHPDASKSAILEGVAGASRAKKVEALETLVGDGIVDRDKEGLAHTHRIAQNPQGHGTATVRHGSGHGGTGNGGGKRGAEGPPLLTEGDPQPRSAEPVNQHTCDCTGCDACGDGCDKRLGPTAETCPPCRSGGPDA